MTIASSQWPQHPGTIGLRSPECRTHALQVFRSISNRLSRSELATWQSRMILYTLGSLHHHYRTPSWWLVFGAVMFFWKHVRSGHLLKMQFWLSLYVSLFLLLSSFMYLSVSTFTVHDSFLFMMCFFIATCNIIYSKYPVSLSHWQGIQFVPLLALKE